MFKLFDEKTSVKVPYVTNVGGHMNQAFADAPKAAQAVPAETTPANQSQGAGIGFVGVEPAVTQKTVATTTAIVPSGMPIGCHV